MSQTNEGAMPETMLMDESMYGLVGPSGRATP